MHLINEDYINRSRDLDHIRGRLHRFQELMEKHASRDGFTDDPRFTDVQALIQDAIQDTKDLEILIRELFYKNEGDR